MAGETASPEQPMSVEGANTRNAVPGRPSDQHDLAGAS